MDIDLNKLQSELFKKRIKIKKKDIRKDVSHKTFEVPHKLNVAKRAAMNSFNFNSQNTIEEQLNQELEQALAMEKIFEEVTNHPDWIIAAEIIPEHQLYLSYTNLTLLKNRDTKSQIIF